MENSSVHKKSFVGVRGDVPSDQRMLWRGRSRGRLTSAHRHWPARAPQDLWLLCLSDFLFFFSLEDAERNPKRNNYSGQTRETVEAVSFGRRRQNVE
jgi:hypothetical protein